MCGVIGVANHKDAAKITYMGLYALQHRGEESAGIVSYDKEDIHIVKNSGLVADVFGEQSLQELKGDTAIGHCRYSTTGLNNFKNIQPFLAQYKNKAIAVAHNGKLTNTEELCNKLEEEGAIFRTSMDSEVIVHLLARTKNKDLQGWVVDVLSRLEGAFSLIFLVGDVIIGARDPQGFRPLCLGRLDGSYILASESCALDLIGAQYIREIAPGEIVLLKDKEMTSVYLQNKQKKVAQCIFENIYFARPDSDILGDNVYEVRKRLGVQLAKEYPVDSDFAMSIPDSGNYAALGYAQELGLRYEVGMIRNHYIGRAFIQPTQILRDLRVKIKLNPISKVLKGKKIVIIEDSIVRGTTLRSRIEVLRRVGVKEIHMRISCPPIVSPCFYGIEFPDKKELIGSNRTLKQIADFIRVDSLKYLSLEGMLSVMKNSDQFCHACFTGKYPVKPPRNKSKYLLEAVKTA